MGKSTANDGRSLVFHDNLLEFKVSLSQNLRFPTYSMHLNYSQAKKPFKIVTTHITPLITLLIKDLNINWLISDILNARVHNLETIS